MITLQDIAPKPQALLSAYQFGINVGELLLTKEGDRLHFLVTIRPAHAVGDTTQAGAYFDPQKYGEPKLAAKVFGQGMDLLVRRLTGLDEPVAFVPVPLPTVN